MTPALELGQVAPPFSNLLGVDGRHYSTSDFEDKKFLVLAFVANRCPTARVYRFRMEAIQREYAGKGVQMIAINSDSQYIHPEESYPEMVKTAKQRGYNFPYLKDEDQSLGRSMGAVVTLHAFILDEGRRLRYRGRIDDSRIPKNVTSHDLRRALDELISGKPVSTPDTEPFACTIDYT